MTYPIRGLQEFRVIDDERLREEYSTNDVAVVRFEEERRIPGPLRGLPFANIGDIEWEALEYRRLIVVGSEADLAKVLTTLMRKDLLDVEVGFVPERRSAASRAYKSIPGRRGARRALWGTARRVPLIRDDAGHAIAGAAMWRGVDGLLEGEAVVDDTTLFDGEVAWVRVEPTATMPGLRAAVVNPKGDRQRWVTGRAAQLGTTGAVVTRDGVAAPRPVQRSTFYRHVKGWLLVG